MNTVTKILAFLGFGLLGLLGGMLLENYRIIPVPFAVAVAIAAMGIGWAIMSRWGEV